MLLPLSFVVFISMIKDIFEDVKRHKTDNLENNRKVNVGNPATGQFEQSTWMHVHVGRIVKVYCDEYFPCDLILLNSSAPKGICYIETKNLDGETNLKIKSATKDTALMANDDEEVMKKFTGAVVECEKPNEFLYKFEGNISINGTTIPVGEN